MSADGDTVRWPAVLKARGSRQGVALMELVLSNRQGELSPLEIGMHVLKAVPLGKRGRGNKGDGLAEYAEAVGKNKATISRLRTAAEVLKGCDTATFSGLLDKAQQLYEIHALPAACWPVMVAALVKHGWSAADTSHWVAKVATQPMTRCYR